MKSGPALHQTESHRSIHDAAYYEAKEMTGILEKMRATGNRERSLEVAYVLIEQWKARTLQHADAEEDGLYSQALEADSSLETTIIRLKRDHEILRCLVYDIQTALDTSQTVTEDVMLRFYALLPVVQYHSRQEENRLVKTLQRGNLSHGT